MNLLEKKVIDVLDYSKGLMGLPKSDVLKFRLEGNSSIVIRPRKNLIHRNKQAKRIKNSVSVTSESNGILGVAK